MNKAHMLHSLVQLATIDQELAGIENNWILQLGSRWGLSNDQISEAFRHPYQTPEMNQMAEEERFEYLYNLVQLMKIDGKIFLKEISFCERLANKLGYKSGVVRALSGYIYSDPSITADRQMLMGKAKRYRIQA